jgi:hypothetical protein
LRDGPAWEHSRALLEAEPRVAEFLKGFPARHWPTASGNGDEAMTLNLILRMLAALALMAVLFFCVFGFLASYEYSEASRRLPSQAAYGAIGLACAAGVFRLLRRRRHGSVPKP